MIGLRQPQRVTSLCVKRIAFDHSRVNALRGDEAVRFLDEFSVHRNTIPQVGSTLCSTQLVTEYIFLTPYLDTFDNYCDSWTCKTITIFYWNSSLRSLGIQWLCPSQWIRIRVILPTSLGLDFAFIFISMKCHGNVFASMPTAHMTALRTLRTDTKVDSSVCA